jgi:hypothetical protein
MKFFTYGKDVLAEVIYTPTTINKLNQIGGGLWGYKKETHYSELFRPTCIFSAKWHQS